METGSISKNVVPMMTGPTRSEQLVAAGAVKTELAAEAAVQQAGESAAARFAPGGDADFRASVEAALRDVIERNISVDPRTRELVYQAVSKETGVVVRQVPDEGMLRLRAYMREMRAVEDNGRSGRDVQRVEKIA